MKSADRPPSSVDVGRKTLAGLGWLVGRTVGTRVVNLGGQLLLAHLLLREHFDLIALAYTVIMFSSLLQQAGLREVLIKNADSIAELQNPAFWMSLATGLLAGGAVVAVTPLAAWFYGRPELSGLLYLLAIAAPLSSVAILPRAMLQIRMDFRFLATIEWAHATALMVLTVILAWSGFGAYSFALPHPIVSLASTVAYWLAARPTVKAELQTSRWRDLYGNNLRTFIGHVANTATFQGDYIILGRFFGKQVVGTYYFAFNLSAQTIRLFTINLSHVLLPALASLASHPERQSNAFVRALKMLTLIGTPLCFLQAALVDPVGHLVLPERWHDAIFPMQILSIGMIGRLTASPSQSMLLAQGRFTTYLRISVVYAVVFLLVVASTARFGSMIAVALAVSCCIFVHGPVQTYLAVYKQVAGVRELARIYGPPLLSSLASTAGVVATTALLPSSFRGHVTDTAAVIIVGVPTYLLLARHLAPAVWQDSASQARTALQSLRKRAAANAASEPGVASQSSGG